MNDVEIIGRAVAVETPSRPPATDIRRADEQALLTLLEAAAVSGVPVHMLKSAIYSGVLPAARCGRCLIMRVDLDKWVRENWQLRETPG